MTPIRRKMIEDMQLHGLSEATQKSYVGHVRQLAAYYHKSPDQLSEEEVRRYVLYLQNEKKAAHATCAVAVAALRFLALLDFRGLTPYMGVKQRSHSPSSPTRAAETMCQPS